MNQFKCLMKALSVYTYAYFSIHRTTTPETPYGDHPQTKKKRRTFNGSVTNVAISLEFYRKASRRAGLKLQTATSNC